MITGPIDNRTKAISKLKPRLTFCSTRTDTTAGCCHFSHCPSNRSTYLPPGMDDVYAESLCPPSDHDSPSSTPWKYEISMGNDCTTPVSSLIKSPSRSTHVFCTGDWPTIRMLRLPFSSKGSLKKTCVPSGLGSGGSVTLCENACDVDPAKTIERKPANSSRTMN